MGAQENKQAAEEAYRAFSNGDGEAAMKNMDDSIEWKVRGDNALTGSYNGKEAVAELWGKFLSKEVQHPSRTISSPTATRWSSWPRSRSRASRTRTPMSSPITTRAS